MKRYPHGAAGPFFFMKRTPVAAAGVAGDVRDRARLGQRHRFPDDSGSRGAAWVVNLGCIDLNQWYARCDDVDRPDYFHFDLDPGPGAPFEQVLEAALLRARRARHAEDAVLPEDERLKGDPRVRADQARADAKRRLDVHEGARDDARRALPEDPDRPVSCRKAAARPRAGRLQPERLGAHPGERLLRAPDANAPASRRRSRGKRSSAASRPNSSPSTSS